MQFKKLSIGGAIQDTGPLMTNIIASDKVSDIDWIQNIGYYTESPTFQASPLRQPCGNWILGLAGDAILIHVANDITYY